MQSNIVVFTISTLTTKEEMCGLAISSSVCENEPSVKQQQQDQKGTEVDGVNSGQREHC